MDATTIVDVMELFGGPEAAGTYREALREREREERAEGLRAGRSWRRRLLACEDGKLRGVGGTGGDLSYR